MKLRTFKTIANIILCLSFLISCGTNERTETSLNSEAKVKLEPKILNKGIGGNGNAIWVDCQNHTQKTIITINNQPCHTTYYKDHLTCELPKEFVGKKIDELTIALIDSRNTTSAIDIFSFGIGGNAKNAIWVTCTGHTKNTIAVLGDTELVTTYYKDHITASLPNEYIGKSNLTIKLVDKTSGVESREITIK